MSGDDEEEAAPGQSSESPATRHSGHQPPLQPCQQVHAFMQDGDDQGPPPGRMHVEDVVMPAARYPHLRMTVRKGPGHRGALADGAATCFQLPGVTLLLPSTPFPEGVAGDAP